jgi:hypothetical protein
MGPIGAMKTAVGRFVVVALVASLFGFAGPSHAATGSIRILIPGAFTAPSGTSGDGQVTLQIGVGLPVFQVNAAGAAVGGSIATVTFARWSDTVVSPNFGPQSTLMVFRLPDGLMVIATGVATSTQGLVSSFSATAPFHALTGAWDITTGTLPADALVTFTYDTNPHIKETASLNFVAGSALTAVATKSIPAIATVEALRNNPLFGVVGTARGGPVGSLIGYTASNITGHASELVQLRAIFLPTSNLHLLFGCAAPNPSAGITCLLGGTGFATHLSGDVIQIPGSVAKATISGVVDADLVFDIEAALP